MTSALCGVPFTPLLCQILIIRNHSPPPAPSYTRRGIRSFRRQILKQQRLLCQLISILGSDFLVSFTIEYFPTRPQILTIGELMEQTWIFVGDLHSVVSLRRNHLCYVGGLTCLSTPLSRIEEVYAMVSASRLDTTPLQYY
jgi:hypothetical protein